MRPPLLRRYMVKALSGWRVEQNIDERKQLQHVIRVCDDYRDVRLA